MNLQQRRTEYLRLAGCMFDLLHGEVLIDSAGVARALRTPAELRRDYQENGRLVYPSPGALAEVVGMQPATLRRYEREGVSRVHDETMAHVRKLSAALNVRESEYLAALTGLASSRN